MKKAAGLKPDQFIKKDNFSCKILLAEKTDSSVRVKIFNMDTGETENFVCPQETVFEECQIEYREMSLHERSSDRFIFRDDSTAEDLDIGSDMIGQSVLFLNEKAKVKIIYYNQLPVSVELPDIALLEVQATEDIEKDPANTEYIKEALLMNGKTIMVPAFIKTGDKVLVHIETGQYIRRE